MLFMKVFADGAGEAGRRYRTMGSRNAQGPMMPGRSADLQRPYSLTRAERNRRSSARTAAVASGSIPEGGPQTAPKKRGRPKGSTNRAKPNTRN